MTTIEQRPAAFIEPRAYFAPDLYEREMRELLPACWILVADIDQLADRGDYVTEQIGDESVIVIRGQDGAIHAYANVCPHRASTLLDGEGSCGRSITCPYHGWSWNLDGSLLGVPLRDGLDREIDTADYSLVELRLDTWERWVFVNIDGQAPPLRQYLEDIPALLAPYHITGTQRGAAIDDTIAVNWKVFIDNSVDDYHLPIVHPQSLMPMFTNIREFQEREGSSNVNVLYSPAADWLREAMPALDTLSEEAATGVYTIDIFPNLTMLAFPDGGLTTLRTTPMGLDRSRIRLQNYAFRSATEDGGTGENRLAQMIQAEDYRVVARVQQGLKSRFYKPGPAHLLELRTRRFQQRWAAALGLSHPE